ncbi:MAG: hypothetical protein A2Y58_03205 [Chloroflexi bacterium RBG_13_51_52]|nr:MAG: hypothetical protein A2Y58_03205 [Chloroflexi bacterium RBG_13_51_52]
MKLDDKTVRLLKTWGVAGAIFIVIAITSIGFIFTPVEQAIEFFDGTVMTEEYQPTGILGGILLAHAWEIYPNYVIGLGIVAFTAFGGAVFCVYTIEKARRGDKGEEDITSSPGH